MKPSSSILPIQQIARAILVIRGQTMMLSRDLVVLYGVAVKTLSLLTAIIAGSVVTL